VAKMSVPTLADWCSIELISEDGGIEQVEVVHHDPEKLKWAKETRKKIPPDLEKDAALPYVLKTGKPLYIPKITPEVIKKFNPSKRERLLLKELNIKSLIFVPLKVLYKTVGVITFVSTRPDREFTQLDFSLADQLASRASLAMENAKLYETVENERERLNTLLSSTPGIIWEAELDKNNQVSRINYVSNFIEVMLGYSSATSFGKKDFWSKIVHPDDVKRFKEEMAKIAISKKKGVIRMRLITKNKGVIWTETRMNVVKNNGKVTGLRGVTMDITESIEEEQRKDNFISLASHELKTPLTSLKVYNHLFQKRVQKYEDSDIGMYLQKTDLQIGKLTNLINDLLDLSRIQAGKLLYRREPTDFDFLIEDVVEMMRKNSKSHKILLRGKVDENVELDQNRISQVVTNFISNAMKYSPKNKKIIIEKKKKDGHVLLSVKDSGKGIPKKYHKKIFERFFQVDKEEERTASGLGIGLYICSEIIKNHNGKIWVESKINKGTTFYFSLPFSHKKIA